MYNVKKYGERVVVIHNSENGKRTSFSLLPRKALTQKWLTELGAEYGVEEILVVQEWSHSAVNHFSSGNLFTYYRLNDIGRWWSEKQSRVNW